MKQKAKGGRPSYVPTERDRAQVKTMAAMGITEIDIGKVIGVSAPTLRKYFAVDLDTGHIEANAKVAQSLFRQATNPEKPNVTAAIFWLKARAGWRDGSRGYDDEDTPGKKAQAQAEARTAAVGTDWDELLPEAHTVQ
jgi:hypothetical protein